MYDTVNMWFDRSLVNYYNVATITSNINNYSEYYNKGKRIITGHLNNYRIYASDSGVCLNGSLCKYFYGNNINILNRKDTRETIEKISDELNLPIYLAKVNRVDFAANLTMQEAVYNYFPYLGDKRYFKRVLATNDSLYYNTKEMQLYFYNKTKEAKEKKGDIPIEFKDENLLRYEIRYEKKLPKRFGMREVTAANLYDEKFYQNLKNQWASEYSSIYKINKPSIVNTIEIKTPLHGKKMLCGLMLAKEGYDFIESYLRELKAKNVFPDPKNYSRLKSDLTEMANMPEISERSELIVELDDKIALAKEYYL